jgi:hypothetical protein
MYAIAIIFAWAVFFFKGCQNTLPRKGQECQGAQQKMFVMMTCHVDGLDWNKHS